MTPVVIVPPGESADVVTLREFRRLKAKFAEYEQLWEETPAQYFMRPGAYKLEYNGQTRRYFYSYNGEKLTDLTPGEKLVQQMMLHRDLLDIREDYRKKRAARH